MVLKFLSMHFRHVSFWLSSRHRNHHRHYISEPVILKIKNGKVQHEAGILHRTADLLNLQSCKRGLKHSNQTSHNHKSSMISGNRHMITLTALLFLLMTTGADDCHAQRWGRNRPGNKEEKVSVQEVRASLQENTQTVKGDSTGVMPFFIEGKDTIYYGTITASKVYSRVPRQKGKDWRKYYRLVHNFSKSYPYALVARKLVTRADSTIAADKLKGAKREKYITTVQKELFDVFEGQMRKLTVSQGALIMKLVDREVGKSSYNIIKGYKSGITAGFWQGIAKIFGSDLKKPYDPEGEDKEVEELVKIWEAGDFPALYWSLFWTDPPELPIPEHYL